MPLETRYRRRTWCRVIMGVFIGWRWWISRMLFNVFASNTFAQHCADTIVFHAFAVVLGRITTWFLAFTLLHYCLSADACRRMSHTGIGTPSLLFSGTDHPWTQMFRGTCRPVLASDITWRTKLVLLAWKQIASYVGNVFWSISVLSQEGSALMPTVSW